MADNPTPADDRDEIAEVNRQRQDNLPDPNSAAAAMALFGGGEVPFYASFDLKSEQGQDLLFKAAQGADADLFQMHDKVISVEHIYASHAQTIDPDSGEIVELIRIVLVTPEGECFQCYSKGVRKSINLLAGIYGLPPWKGGRPVRVCVERLKGNRNFLTLKMAKEPPPAKGKRT